MNGDKPWHIVKAEEVKQVSDKLTVRFVAVYMLLGVVVAAAVIGCWKGLTYHRYRLPADVVHKAQLKQAVASVAGDQNLVAQCEASVTGTINQNQGTITKPYKLVSVKDKGSQVEVRITATSNLFAGDLVCSFSKSNWHLDGVKALQHP